MSGPNEDTVGAVGTEKKLEERKKKTRPDWDAVPIGSCLVSNATSVDF